MYLLIMKEIPVAHVALQYYYGQLHEERELDFKKFLAHLKEFVALNKKFINEKSLNEPDFLLKTDGFKLPENEGENFLEIFKKLFIESQEIVTDYVLRYLEYISGAYKTAYGSIDINNRMPMYEHRPANWNKK